MTFVVWLPDSGETEEDSSKLLYGDPDHLEAILEEWIEEYDNRSANEWTTQLMGGGLNVCVRAETPGSRVQKFTLRAEATVNYYAHEQE